MAITISRRSAVIYLLAAPASHAATLGAMACESGGAFQGSVITEWLPNGRDMRLAEPYEYVDPKGRRWPVPKGAVVDGASIPPVFWSVIGGPFEGLYRGPSVIHDYYCEKRTRNFSDVHQVFHDAMLCAGVGKKTAWLMFQAVNRFGPRWDDPKLEPECEIIDKNYDFERCARNAAPPPVQWPSANENDLLAFVEDVESKSDPADLVALRASIDKAR
jgi:hypothetical protein